MNKTLVMSLVLLLTLGTVGATNIDLRFFLFGLTEPVYEGTEELKEELTSCTASMFTLGKQGGIGSCSGTIIKEERGNHHLITAKHCLHVTEEMYFDNVPASLIIASADDDLAYVILDGKIKDKKVANIARWDSSIGETIHHVGYPSEHLYISTGKVHRITKDDYWAYLESRGGCSGGSIFNEKGELAGVLWGGYDTYKEKITVYEPIKDVKKFLKTMEKLIDIKDPSEKPKE